MSVCACRPLLLARGAFCLCFFSVRMFENNIRVMKSEVSRLQHEQAAKQAALKEGLEKVKMNKQLPYLVSNVIEILNLEPE